MMLIGVWLQRMNIVWNLANIPRNNVNSYRFLKRVIDVMVSGTALLILTPILGLIALLIRLRMGSPVIFRQIRPGLHANPFVFYKFRTMTCDCDKNGCLLPDECRISELGQFLRRTSLDEFPQLWNVLKGDMSLVGPRPLLMDYLPLYTRHQARRHEIKPGITGWAQVNGRNALTWERKFELDVWYVDHRSLALDARILFLTISMVLKREGINQQGRATVDAFRGHLRND